MSVEHKGLIIGRIVEFLSQVKIAASNAIFFNEMEIKSGQFDQVVLARNLKAKPSITVKFLPGLEDFEGLYILECLQESFPVKGRGTRGFLVMITSIPEIANENVYCHEPTMLLDPTSQLGPVTFIIRDCSKKVSPTLTMNIPLRDAPISELLVIRLASQSPGPFILGGFALANPVPNTKVASTLRYLAELIIQEKQKAIINKIVRFLDCPQIFATVEVSVGEVVVTPNLKITQLKGLFSERRNIKIAVTPFRNQKPELYLLKAISQVVGRQSTGYLLVALTFQGICYPPVYCPHPYMLLNPTFLFEPVTFIIQGCNETIHPYPILLPQGFPGIPRGTLGDSRFVTAANLPRVLNSQLPEEGRLSGATVA